jgi:hypothetical protein
MGFLPCPNIFKQEEIVSALAHDDLFVRDGALALLDGWPNPPLEAAKMAISAVDRFGWEDAFEYPHKLTNPPLTGKAQIGSCNSATRTGPCQMS